MGDMGLFLLVIISISVVILLALAIVILYNTSERRIFKELQKAHKQELAHKNKLITNTVETQEKERKRIAADLHDEVGSKLNIVNVNLNILRSMLSGREDVLETLDQIEMSLTHSIEKTRNISHELHPPILTKFGIQSALTALARQVEKTGVIDVDIDIGIKWKPLSADQELHIYRIYQELISNTIKHANATQIIIRAQNVASSLLLSYQDNGQGFQNEINESNGLGMNNIVTRVDLINGQLNIDTNNEGVKFEITI